jgi:hypothetical protein
MTDQAAMVGGFVPNFQNKMSPNPNRLIRKTTVNIEISLGKRIACKD